MKIVVLTTETSHHTYFVREVAQFFPIELVVVEQNTLSPPFETHHPYEEEEQVYEQTIFFGGEPTTLGAVAPTFTVESANAPETLARLKAIQPTIIVVFGTGKLLPATIALCPEGIINLHRGDPELYRGLDSHLWAIYHRDYNLVTTLHRVNPTLDDGAIILQGAIALNNSMRLHQLRRYGTEICVQLVVTALEMQARQGSLITRPQRQKGRYYSFMPTALKEICRVRFEKYVTQLKDHEHS